MCHWMEESGNKIRDGCKNLSRSVDKRVSRGIQSTRHENDTWHKEVNTNLKVAKQEIDAVKQDGNKRS